MRETRRFSCPKRTPSQGQMERVHLANPEDVVEVPEIEVVLCHHKIVERASLTSTSRTWSAIRVIGTGTMLLSKKAGADLTQHVEEKKALLMSIHGEALLHEVNLMLPKAREEEARE